MQPNERLPSQNSRSFKIRLPGKRPSGKSKEAGTRTRTMLRVGIRERIRRGEVPRSSRGARTASQTTGRPTRAGVMTSSLSRGTPSLRGNRNPRGMPHLRRRVGMRSQLGRKRRQRGQRRLRRDGLGQLRTGTLQLPIKAAVGISPAAPSGVGRRIGGNPSVVLRLRCHYLRWRLLGSPLACQPPLDLLRTAWVTMFFRGLRRGQYLPETHL
mmetsp:Transcript_22160/g.58754  ORF Transcript_22160/g.58754 Transcript_22160/m.58754 type:complete len:212 (+) Transcript_22160:2271-2906(+)